MKTDFMQSTVINKSSATRRYDPVEIARLSSRSKFRNYFIGRYEAYWNVIWCAITLMLALDAILFAIENREIESLVYFLIHMEIALLFLVRNQPRAISDNSTGYLVAVLSTFYLFLFDPDPSLQTALQPVGLAVTLAGSALCLLSILSIGRCFGILPMDRGLQTNHMYRFVRHPIYASYIVMDLGLLLSYSSLWNLLVLGIGIALFLWRIGFEEHLLAGNADYRMYRKTTPFRLIPGVY